MLNLRSR